MTEASKPAPIPPTVGRVVLYYPKGVAPPTQPCRADVCFVHPDGRINISWTSAEGIPHAATAVYLVQPGEDPPKSGNYAFWMPLQVGQGLASKKLDETVAALHDKINQAVNFVRSENGRQAQWRGQIDLKLDEFRTRVNAALKKVDPSLDVRYPTGIEQKLLAERDVKDEKTVVGPGGDTGGDQPGPGGPAVPAGPEGAGPPPGPPEPGPVPGEPGPVPEPDKPQPEPAAHPKRRHGR